MNDSHLRIPAATTQFIIRHATPADLPAINAIYNHYVPHSTVTYQIRFTAGI